MKLNDLALYRTQALIGGAWCAADNGAAFDVTNPASGERPAREQ